MIGLEEVMRALGSGLAIVTEPGGYSDALQALGPAPAALVLVGGTYRGARVDAVVVQAAAAPSREALLRLSIKRPGARLVEFEGGSAKREEVLEPPELVRGYGRCPNQACITNRPREVAVPTFRLISREKRLYRCEYCGALVAF